MFFTYILFLSDGTYYTGITNNLVRRINEHRAGQSKSTRKKRPIRLIHAENFNTRIEARKQEVRIKNKGAKRYLQYKKFAP